MSANATGGGLVDEVRVEMPAPQVKEGVADGANGWPMAGLALLGVLGGIGVVIAGAAAGNPLAIAAGVLLFLAGLVAAAGLTPVNPGEARVVQLLGRYRGTVRADGLRWVNPLTQRRRVSTRIRNH